MGVPSNRPRGASTWWLSGVLSSVHRPLRARRAFRQRRRSDRGPGDPGGGGGDDPGLRDEPVVRVHLGRGTGAGSDAVGWCVGGGVGVVRGVSSCPPTPGRARCLRSSRGATRTHRPRRSPRASMPMITKCASPALGSRCGRRHPADMTSTYTADESAASSSTNRL